MSKQKWIFFFVVLALIAGTASLLALLKRNPRLGQPGIRAVAIPGDVKMKIGLPERVLDFASTNVPEPEIVLRYLPKDTSYAERVYVAPDGFWVQATIVLMGTDRTSIHNADFCLPGAGFIPRKKSIVDVRLDGPERRELPVSRWDLSGTFKEPDGHEVERHGVYLFWFVADGVETPSHLKMMEKFAVHLLKTGESQRWAYLAYFAPCAPGQEDATFARMEKLIAASVPELQPPPNDR